jgi:hypothetical protein
MSKQDEDKGGTPGANLEKIRGAVLEQLGAATELKLPEDTMHLSAALRNIDAMARLERSEAQALGTVPPGLVGELRAAVWQAGQEIQLSTDQSDTLVSAFDVEVRRRMESSE